MSEFKSRDDNGENTGGEWFQWLRLCFIQSIVRLHPTFTFIQVGDGEKISGLHKKWSDKKKKWTIYETVSLL